MSHQTYAQINTRQTPQNEPILGSNQVVNNAGGYVYQLDDWARLDRFLVLGSSGGTYYVGERKLTKENAEVVVRLLKEDGQRVVERIVEISDAGRAPKNDPALFALALAAALGDEPTRRLAFERLPKIARIGTHLQHFCAYLEGLRGWGRMARRGVADWFQSMPVGKLAQQVVKYQSRDGWSMDDLLRLSHPKTADPVRNAVYHYVTKGWESVGEQPHDVPELRIIWAFERGKKAESEAEMVRLIRDYGLTHEMVTSEWKSSPAIWEALLDGMPLGALIRQLPTLTRVGLLKPGSDSLRLAVARLGDAEAIKRARIHPLGVLIALKTYQSGRSLRGSTTWAPISQVVDALDGAFYHASQGVVPTNKRILLALDVSGSMRAPLSDSPLSCLEASAAMALVTAKTEPNYQVVAFTEGSRPSRWSNYGRGYGAGLSRLDISPRQRLDDVVRKISGLPFGGTDCALPMIWAEEQNEKFEAIMILTDNETWAGAIHPIQALRSYRQRIGREVKLITVGMTSTGFSIADPDDRGSLDVVGFDTAAPSVISDFIAGR